MPSEEHWKIVGPMFPKPKWHEAVHRYRIGNISKRFCSLYIPALVIALRSVPATHPLIASVAPSWEKFNSPSTSDECAYSEADFTFDTLSTLKYYASCLGENGGTKRGPIEAEGLSGIKERRLLLH